jgi:hypothetical protein
MKKLPLLIYILVILVSNTYGQLSLHKYNYPNFDSTYIRPADLIVEATITNLSYFQDSSIKFIESNIGYDNKGIWFIKYRMIIHKIFKGNCKSKIDVVSPYFGDIKKIKGIKYSYLEVNAPCMTNFETNSTGIFFLYINMPNDTGYQQNTFKFSKFFPYCNANWNIGNYYYCAESGAGYKEKESWIVFDFIDDLYRYIENSTKQKRKDLTKKEFILLNTESKLREYQQKYFADSLNYETFIAKLKSGRINQLNKDSFICNSKYLTNKANKKSFYKSKKQFAN